LDQPRQWRTADEDLGAHTSEQQQPRRGDRPGRQGGLTVNEEHANNLGATGRLARWSARHAWRVVITWLVVAVAVTVSSSIIGGTFTTEIEFTYLEVESQRAKAALEDFRGPEPLLESVVVRSDSLTVDDPEFETFVGGLVTDLRSHPDDFAPESVTSFYESGVAEFVSADRNTTIVPVRLIGELDDSSERVELLESILEERSEGTSFVVLSGGFATVNEAFNRAAEEAFSTELQVLPIAFIILILVFGAIVASVLPMAMAAVALMLAFGFITLITNVWELNFFVANVTIMIGLAVGIDYALFIIERFREERFIGRDVTDSVAVAGDTATRAVVFSGVTVVIALLGMLLTPMSIFQSFGIGASLAVIFSVLLSLTMLPAVLRLLGDNVNRLSIPLFGRHRVEDHDRGFWAATARGVMARPWLSMTASVVLLVALTLPFFAIELGFTGPSAIPESFQARQAFDILDEEFNAGRASPTEGIVLVDDVTRSDVQTALDGLAADIETDPELTLLGPPEVSAEENVAVFSFAVPGESASDEAIDAFKRVRDDYVPANFDSVTGAEVLIGGQTPQSADFFEVVGIMTPLVIAFVLSLSFILLLLVFHSIVVPAKAIVMNLLSVGASYGVVVAIFQLGWFADELGMGTVEKIEAWLPLFLFTVLFGLSMDYHVFLLSRVREAFDSTHDNTASVAAGLRSTANIITGAAAIMVAVFGGFALGDVVMFQQMGVGLAVAVFLDATIVRTVLVPSTMQLLGNRNWYLPAWLAWIPDLRVERDPGMAQPAGAPAGGGD
jgi:RND superfamily putative drug exporter